MKFFVPQDSNYDDCYVVQSEGVIRGYAQTPQVNTTVNYRDYYVNSHYMYKDGSQTFSNYSSPPTCLSSTTLTNNVFYRNDIDGILTVFLILSIFCFWIPYKIISRAFGRWLRI